MELGAWVRAARNSKGLNQEQLGDLVGCGKANVSAWENGKHNPSFAQVRAIAEATGYPAPSLPHPAPQPGAPLPPPRNFEDRHWLSDTDWDRWEAVNLILSPAELERITQQYQRLKRQYEEHAAGIQARDPPPKLPRKGGKKPGGK